MPRKVYDDEALRARAIELRKRGLSYRQIAGELGCSVYKVHELISGESPRERAEKVRELSARFDEISSKISEFSSRVSKLEEAVKGLEKTIDSILGGLIRIQIDLDLIRDNAVWKRDNCRHYLEDGYCNNWYWNKEVKGWKMREDTVKGKTVYRLSVRDHPMHCAACPYYAERG